MIREPAEALVLFSKDKINPVFIMYDHGAIRINKVIKNWRERRNLHECIIYLCESEEREDPVELRWDTIINRWFVEKL